MACVVDSYAKTLTLKLFVRLADENVYVREVIEKRQGAIAAHIWLISKFIFALALMNAGLLTGTAVIGIWLWAEGAISTDMVLTAPWLAWRIVNVAAWMSWEVAGIFKNTGVGQEGMQAIAVPQMGGNRRMGARGVARRNSFREANL
jgi:ATP-binding cassette subfamily B multidrug efflux pump